MPTDPAARRLLDISGLEAGYGKVRVLWGVDLDVGQQETVVLLGANGAGKTTLLRTLMGLIGAWAGHVRFAGTVAAFEADESLRHEYLTL